MRARKEKVMKCMIVIGFLLGLSSFVFAEVKTERIEYKCGDTVFEGYMAWDDAVKGKRPGVLVVHEWWGLNAYVERRARELASLGYVAFAADMYGKGVKATTTDEAKALATTLRKDRALMRDRASAALSVLCDRDICDTQRVAAMGYCFGGGVALELARYGANIRGVVSFHGNLDTPNPKDAKNIKGKVLVLTGADDPSVPMKQVEEFMDEMRSSKVDYQIILYGGAVHAFTNPDAGEDLARGAAYNADADKRSWQAMKDFFAEIFK
jgi:dienelactone hydrolase